jgi:RimJ/RimL family protein N-acetyltransferase
MIVERTFDAEFFNRIRALPEVRPGIGGDLAPDVTDIIADPINYALRTEHGGFILISHGAGHYSVHSQFAAEGRGQHAIAAMRDGLDFMFTRTDAMRITSFCPDDNLATLMLALKGGARRLATKETDPMFGPGTVVEWDVVQWAKRSAANEEDGKQFHELLEAAKQAEGSTLPVHDDHPEHDRMVGAATKMCRRGQARKGVILYNLWAGAAGYMPISLLAENPPLVDVVDGIISLDEAGELQVVALRQGAN